METFDLAVIGAGPGGCAAAIRAAQLGRRVACVDREASLGGTCLRIGCIPSKALLESSRHFAFARHSLGKHGVVVGSVDLDLDAMMKRKNQVVSRLSQGVELLFRKNKIASFNGAARLTSPRSIAVNGTKAHCQLNAENILIATGSLPVALPGVPFDGERILSSTDALALSSVPEHLAVVGAGYIGLELGSVWSRLGAQVTVMESRNQILPGMDGDLSNEAQKLLARQGLQFQLGAQVRKIAFLDGRVSVHLNAGQSIIADKVLVAVGRVPNTAALGLAELGVALDEQGAVQVDEAFATNVLGIFAIGDVVGGPMLAHKAEEEGIAFAESLVRGGKANVHYGAIPSAVFTEPEIAAIGRTERQLIETGVSFRKAAFPYRANGRARAANQTNGFVKLLIAEDAEKILGAHILGDRAGEMINEVALAINMEKSAFDLARSCHAHPTFGETLREAARQACGLGIHN